MQQCLPLAVLKLSGLLNISGETFSLQQCLPLAVLKLANHPTNFGLDAFVATVLTACGIETKKLPVWLIIHDRCNSAYRLRY